MFIILVAIILVKKATITSIKLQHTTLEQVCWNSLNRNWLSIHSTTVVLYWSWHLFPLEEAFSFMFTSYTFWEIVEMVTGYLHW